MDLTNLVAIHDPTAILPHTHKFPTQKVKLHNVILTGDDHKWYADTDITQAEVLFAVETLRGNLSLFAESEAAVSKTLERITLKDMNTGERILFAALENKYIELIRNFKPFSTGRFLFDVDSHVEVIMDDQTAAALVDNGLQPLTQDDVDELVSNWDYSKQYPETAVQYVSYNIANQPSAGIRGQDGQLLGWGLAHIDWNIGMLKVKETERRKGYGKQIIAQVCHKAYKMRHTPYAYASPDNIPSLSLLIGLGFKRNVDVCWLRIVKQ